MTIDDWRSRIDELDRKLVELLNERSRCALEIAKIKSVLERDVVDPERERAVLRNVQSQNRGPLDTDALGRLFERIIEECRLLEHRISKKQT